MRRHKSAAQPIEIARQVATQAADAARSAAQNVDVAEVRDTIAAQAARAAEAAQSAAQNVDLAAVRDNVTTEMSKANDLMLKETRRRPLRSLLIALGVGAVTGAVLDRMSKRRKRAGSGTTTTAGSMPAQSSMQAQEQAEPQGSMT